MNDHPDKYFPRYRRLARHHRLVGNSFARRTRHRFPSRLSPLSPYRLPYPLFPYRFPSLLRYPPCCFPRRRCRPPVCCSPVCCPRTGADLDSQPPQTELIFAYVVNNSGNNVVQIDTKNDIVVSIIPVGLSPYGVATTPYGRAYVTNYGSHSVSYIKFVIVMDSIQVGVNPQGIAITPDGKHAYITNFSDQSVTVIDTTTNTVITTITNGIGEGPIAIAITSDRTRAYMTSFFAGTVDIIDTTTNTVILSPIGVGDRPIGIAITPDGTKAYVANSGSNSVSVINTSNNNVTTTITDGIGNDPVDIAITPDGRHVYIVSASGRVSVFNTANNTVVAQITVPITAIKIAITPDGTKAYVTINLFNEVYVIDTVSNTVIKIIREYISGPIGVSFVSL